MEGIPQRHELARLLANIDQALLHTAGGRIAQPHRDADRIPQHASRQLLNTLRQRCAEQRQHLHAASDVSSADGAALLLEGTLIETWSQGGKYKLQAAHRSKVQFVLCTHCQWFPHHSRAIEKHMQELVIQLLGVSAALLV